jgi:hypothetical protein
MAAAVAAVVTVAKAVAKRGVEVVIDSVDVSEVHDLTVVSNPSYC